MEGKRNLMLDAFWRLIRGSFMKRKVDRVTANHYLRLGIAFTVTFPLAIPNLSCHIRSAATTLDSWRCEYNSMVGRFPFATTLKVLHGCYWRTCSSVLVAAGQSSRNNVPWPGDNRRLAWQINLNPLICGS